MCPTDIEEELQRANERLESEVWDMQRNIREKEDPRNPIPWADRPDIYWCAGADGGCDAYHRADFPACGKASG